MIIADVIVLISFLACMIIGSAFGFGRVLKWVTGGVSGKIISVVICYFIYGVVLYWGFVQALMLKFTTVLQEDGSWICRVLLTIRIDMIVFFAVLFVVVQGLRKLVVSIIGKVMSVDNKVISVVNRILGVVLLTVFAAICMLIAFQVIAWVSGTEGEFYQGLNGSVFGLDSVFRDNPLNSVFESIRLPEQSAPVEP